MEMLVVGLGNPGKAYSQHRHNVGFMCIDLLARRHGLTFKKHPSPSLIAEGTMAGHSVAMVKPQTFMNLSGSAVAQLMHHYHLDTTRLLVLYDDLDLPLGRIRIRASGSSGGHRGVQSIIDSLGSTHFPRVRIGIGRDPKVDPAEYVLTPFRPEELPLLRKALETAADAVETILSLGLDAAMNRFNRLRLDLENNAV